MILRFLFVPLIALQLSIPSFTKTEFPQWQVADDVVSKSCLTPNCSTYDLTMAKGVLQRASEAGVTHFQHWIWEQRLFWGAWPEPTAVEFYRDLFAETRRRGMEPTVKLNSWMFPHWAPYIEFGVLPPSDPFWAGAPMPWVPENDHERTVLLNLQTEMWLQLVREFPEITVWTVGNEPQNMFRTPDGMPLPPEESSAMVAWQVSEFTRFARTINSDIEVVTSPMMGAGVSNRFANWMEPSDYLDLLLPQLYQIPDGVGFNPYPHIIPNLTAEQYAEMLLDYINVIDYHLPGTKLYTSESGTSLDWYNGDVVQASRTLEMMIQETLALHPKIVGFSLFRMVPEDRHKFPVLDSNLEPDLRYFVFQKYGHDLVRQRNRATTGQRIGERPKIRIR